MKKELIVISLVLLLSVSFISAFSWSDLLPSGYAVSDFAINSVDDSCVDKCLEEKCGNYKRALIKKICENRNRDGCEGGCVEYKEESSTSLGSSDKSNSNPDSSLNTETSKETEKEENNLGDLETQESFEEETTPRPMRELKTYLQGYVPNREIKINFMDIIGDAEWQYCNDYECINMDLGEDYSEYGGVSLDYDVVLEDNQKAKKVVNVKLPQTRPDWQVTMGRFNVQLPDVTPLYAIAEVGFANGDTTQTSGEAEIIIDDVDNSLILGRNFARTIPNSITDTMVMDISAFAGQEKTLRVTFGLESNKPSTNIYLDKFYIFTPEHNSGLNELPENWWVYPQIDMTLWPMGVWKKFHATYNSWGAIPIQPFKEYANENELGTLKVLGLNSLGGEDFIDLESSRRWFEENDPQFIEETKIKNLYGETLPEDHPAFIGLVGKYFFDSFSPRFEDYVSNEMDLASSPGGYFFDETNGNIALLETSGPAIVRGYNQCDTYYLPMDDDIMSLFNNWLGDNLNFQEFNLITGENSIEDFNYREWLLLNNLDELFMCRSPFWNKDGSRYSVPLSREYDLFLVETMLKFWKEKNLNAKNMGLVTSGNAGYLPSLTQLFDVGVDEGNFLGETWGGLTEYWRSPPNDRIGIVRPLLMNSILKENAKYYLYDSGDDSKYFTSYDPESDLVKLFLAQIYSTQSIPNLWPFSLSEEKQAEYNYNEISKYPIFILKNQLSSVNLKTFGNIGIFYSEASNMGRSSFNTGNPLNNLGDPDWDQNLFMNWNVYESFIGAAYILLDSHSSFEVIYTGNNWFTEDEIKLFDLNKYDSIILPNTFCLTNNQINTLNQYMNSDGKILAFGEVATCDEWNNPLMTVGLDKSNQNFVYLGGSYDDNIGLDYFVDRKQRDLNTFSNALNQLTSSSIRTTASKDTSILTYIGKEGDRFVTHIINNNYDENTKDMIAQSPFKLTLTLPTGFSTKNKKAYLISPDNDQVIEFQPSQISTAMNQLTLNIPEVYIYSVLIITEEDLFWSSRKLHEAHLLSREAKWDDTYLADEDLILEEALTEFNNGNYADALQLSEKGYKAISKKIKLKEQAYAKIVECERIKSCDPTQARICFYEGDYQRALDEFRGTGFFSRTWSRITGNIVNLFS